MMKVLEDAARDCSGLAKDEALEIDASDVFQRLGVCGFQRLSKEFYGRVFADTHSGFREVFANIAKEEAIRNQSEYLMERFGDPRKLYSKRKGTTLLLGKHAPYQVNEETAARWLYHMEGAVRSVPEIDMESARLLMNFFRYYAFYIAEGVKYCNPQRLVGYEGKHYGGA